MAERKNAGRPRPDPGKLPKYLSPYEYWNFGKGKPYAFPSMRKYSKYITALAEFKDPLRAELSRGPIARKAEKKTWLPTLWRTSGLTFLPFVVEEPTGRVRDPQELQKVLEDRLRDAAKQLPVPPARVRESRFRVAYPVPNAAMNADVVGQPSRPDWSADGTLRHRIGDKRITIVAVIDDGLPFAHRNFRDASGKRTRVEFCWLQSVTRERKQDPSVLFGREYTREQIDRYIARYGDDENALYREAGATAETEDYGSMLDRHASHGAHVMDLATGYAPERGEDPAEEIRIIAVQLPNTITLDTSGFGKDMYMLAAFHYIFDRADRIASEYDIERPRLVVNFSYGFSGGRHDGETELEAAIDELVKKRRDCTGPTALVLPVGNLFLDRLHGQIRKKDFVKRAAKFYWRIQPNDRTSSYLELWFPDGFNPVGYWVELWGPSGYQGALLEIGSDTDDDDDDGADPRRVDDVWNDCGQRVGQISADLHRPDQAKAKPGRWRVLVVMAPSEPEGEGLARVDAGKWTVVVRRERGARQLRDQLPIHCWVQRDADPKSFRSGSRQSYFDDPRYLRYGRNGDFLEEDTDDTFIQRFGSLNGLATAGTSLIVGGFWLGAGLGSSVEDARPARYSSAGTLEKGWPDAKVACSSMSDRSKVLAGTVAAGVHSGALSLVQGTSSAAPFVARQLATAFVTADDRVVEDAAAENYRPLLSGYWEPNGKDELTKARLGPVRVPPHWQPGLER